MRGRGVVLFGSQEGAERGHTGFSVDAWARECKVAGRVSCLQLSQSHTRTTSMSVPTSQSTSAACSLMRAGEQFTGKQGLQYAVGVSAESVGAQAIHMQLLSIPPQGRAKAHKHATHETAIYVMSGEGHVWHGE